MIEKRRESKVKAYKTTNHFFKNSNKLAFLHFLT